METPTELIQHLSSKTLMPESPPPSSPPPPPVHVLEPEAKPEPVRELVLA